MASVLPAIRSSFISRSICNELTLQRRALHTVWSIRPEKIPLPRDLPKQFMSQIPRLLRREKTKSIKIIPKPRDAADICKDPLKAVTDSQIAILDPTGERKALFDQRNPEGVKVGDILRVTFKNGDPFNGVCLNIRARGVDTSFLLRNHLTKVAAEMWVKVFSPNVQSVEIVQRAEKRKRRARLTYMRKPKHDIGSVDGIVRQYLRQKKMLASGTQRMSGHRTSKR
ncbi:hypothetical protein KEM54_000088 [Ascosphaera aggregata]|nr:hypothetical protein KEM54_000088 [Ascosphaera aggregata]